VHGVILLDTADSVVGFVRPPLFHGSIRRFNGRLLTRSGVSASNRIFTGRPETGSELIMPFPGSVLRPHTILSGFPG
jgi:hypothetical protein